MPITGSRCGALGGHNPNFGWPSRSQDVAHRAPFLPPIFCFRTTRHSTAALLREDDLQPYFLDRYDGGRRLAEKLGKFANEPNLLVLALPRGGVPVAYEVARALHAPLDVFLVRKLGFPGHPELAMGAIATGGVRILDHFTIQMYGVRPEDIDRITAEEQRELARRERLYRDDRPAPDVKDHTVILVDDGLATGSTMRAAVEALREEGARKIVVAVPVAPPDTCEAMKSEVDEIVCAVTPEPFRAVGIWYADFSETADDEVRELLAKAGFSGPVSAQEA